MPVRILRRRSQLRKKERNKKAKRVLVVDDNVDLTASFILLLEALGHEAHAAYDGVAALEAAHRLLPDIIILDIGLPGLDGYEVARRLRTDYPRKDTLLIALTGYGQNSDYRHSREAGFDYHMVKPVDLELLQTLLSSSSSK